MQEPITLEKIMKDRPPANEEEAKKADELIKLLLQVEDWEAFAGFGYMWARKYDAYDEYISFLKEKPRTYSECVVFECEYDGTMKPEQH